MGKVFISITIIASFWLLQSLSLTTYLALLALLLFYIYSIHPFTVFQTDGIPGPVPWPVLGTMWAIFTKGVMEADKQYIKQYGNIVGTYEGRTPVLIVADQEILKQILIKQFPYFQNRRGGNMDYPMRRSLLSLRGNQWRQIRSKVTPFFSSMKLKHLIPRVTVCARILTENLRYMTSKNDELEMTKCCRAFAMDSIAATCFGLNLDSQNSHSDPFVINADKIFNFRPSVFVSLMILLFPSLYPLLNKFGFEMFPKDSANFFIQVLNDAIQQRNGLEENQGDLMQMMLDNYSNHSHDNNLTEQEGFTHEEILAQMILFLLAGYETTATTLTIATYCLATNADCQEKLHQEITKIWDGKSLLTMDQLSNMKYLDYFIKETTRLYPPAVRVNRICSSDITVGSYTIHKGTVVIIPIYYIHHDSLVWRNSEQFIPERFERSEWQSRAVSWLAFGGGPRHCIGLRLAMLELKVALAHLVTNFRFSCTPNTQIPLEFTKRSVLQPKQGVRVMVERRLEHS